MSLLNSPKTPNYILSEDYSYPTGPHESKILNSGMFVRPIEIHYVPKHVLDNPLWRGFNKTKEVFVYCRYGIVPVPRNIVREV